jgi:hypothetical protein
MDLCKCLFGQTQSKNDSIDLPSTIVAEATNFPHKIKPRDEIVDQATDRPGNILHGAMLSCVKFADDHQGNEEW